MYYPIYSPTDRKPACVTESALAYQNLWRSLWEQHVAWTRMTIIAAAHDEPGLNQTVARLLQNPKDMGNALRPYYGGAAADGFAALIRQHLLIAIDLVSAAKKGDTQAADEAEKKWYANADEITRFVAGANPYWNEIAFRDMLYRHLALTKAEAVAELSGDYDQSIQLYDEIQNQALGMADAISQGVISQMPWVFR